MSKAIVNGFDISRYAPPPHAEIIAGEVLFITAHCPLTEVGIEVFIKHRAPNSPLTAEMFFDAADNHYLGDSGLILMLALCQQDTMYGTKGEGSRLHNPGNVGDDDEGHTRDYDTWEAGVDAVAAWLARHKVVAPALSQ